MSQVSGAPSPALIVRGTRQRFDYRSWSVSDYAMMFETCHGSEISLYLVCQRCHLSDLQLVPNTAYFEWLSAIDYDECVRGSSLVDVSCCL